MADITQPPNRASRRRAIKLATVNSKPQAALGPKPGEMFARTVIEYKYCGTCRYLDFTNPSQMFCRRYPAQLITVDANNIRALYPVVNPTQDWCGEHKDIPNAL